MAAFFYILSPHMSPGLKSDKGCGQQTELQSLVELNSCQQIELQLHAEINHLFILFEITVVCLHLKQGQNASVCITIKVHDPFDI